MCGMIYIETLDDVKTYRVRFENAAIPIPGWLMDAERRLQQADASVPDTFPKEWERAPAGPRAVYDEKEKRFKAHITSRQKNVAMGVLVS